MTLAGTVGKEMGSLKHLPLQQLNLQEPLPL